eukprot:4250708-Pyramimonas_sp.AAC.1
MGTAHKLSEQLPDRSWGQIMDSFERLASPVPADGWGGILLFLGDGACPHTDNSAGALWRGSVVDNVQFKARFRQPHHPLVDHAWFSIYSYRVDLMHMADHHGIANSVLGN